MKSGLRTVAVLTMALLMLSVCGCFLTVTQNLKNGSTMLKSSYKSLGKDYDELIKSAETYIAEPIEDNLKKFIDTEKMFNEGFQAVGIAIDAMDESIQALKTKKKDE